MNKPGKFIVIEGTDGAGKTTQLGLLKTRMENTGKNVVVFDFPRYVEPSSYFVRQYLEGVYGHDLSPYQASLFYALDRFAASESINAAIEGGAIVLCNRYAGSNMAHQGSKCKNQKELLKYLRWVQDLEYNVLGIPKPDYNIVLRVSAEIAYELTRKRGDREHKNGTAKDVLHENNLSHLQKSEQTYLKLTELFPKQFKLIECTKNGQLLTIESINEAIWQYVKGVI